MLLRPPYANKKYFSNMYLTKLFYTVSVQSEIRKSDTNNCGGPVSNLNFEKQKQQCTQEPNYFSTNFIHSVSAISGFYQKTSEPQALNLLCANLMCDMCSDGQITQSPFEGTSEPEQKKSQ